MPKTRKRRKDGLRGLISTPGRAKQKPAPTPGKSRSAPRGKVPPAKPQDIMVSATGKGTRLVAAAVLGAVFTWSYWPTLVGLTERWSAVADYSHGFLVGPIALGLLYLRRDRFPGLAPGSGWAALAVVTLGLAVRITSARAFLPALDGWSIPIWLGGICLLFGGWKFLKWCLPSLAFLLFMVPLPYRAEHAVAMPLRNVATSASGVLLQCLGQPAVVEGTTIFVNDQELNVARECSGLRMLMGITALATAYIIVVRRPWWQKLPLMLAVAPVAVLANVLRVTLTALLYEYVSGDAARVFSHDAAGWVTNCLAALLFTLVIFFMNRAFIEVVEAEKRGLLGEKGLMGTG